MMKTLIPASAESDKYNIGWGYVHIKESIGIKERLTLADFYLEELTAEYSTIYRSLYEYTKILSKYFMDKGYALISCGPIWIEKIDYEGETASYYWILMKQ